MSLAVKYHNYSSLKRGFRFGGDGGGYYAFYNGNKKDNFLHIMLQKNCIFPYFLWSADAQTSICPFDHSDHWAEHIIVLMKLTNIILERYLIFATLNARKMAKNGCSLFWKHLPVEILKPV